MFIKHIFSNFLYTEQIDFNIDSLSAFSRHTVKESNLIRNDSITQSNFLDTNSPPLKSLINIVENKFNEIHKKIGLSENQYHIVSDAWVNINNNVNIDSAHCHPGSVFSAVYYLKAQENCGDLIFINPNKALSHVIHPTLISNYNCFNEHNHRVIPITGLLIIFPSYLEHYVKANVSGQDRISIAMNSQLRHCT
jgi:uncharacterized protein (TIGR02466 family)